MGNVEKRSRQLKKKDTVQRALLAAVAGPGLLAVAAMAPNVLQLLPMFDGDRTKFKYRLKSVASRLVEKGLIRFKTLKGEKHLEVTPKGKEVIADIRGNERRRKRRWDQRWRVVMFDIPEKKRGERKLFRMQLEEYGFVRLQNSVWVYPHDCEDFIQLLKMDVKARGSVLYLVVESLENDEPLRKRFGL